MNNQLQYMKNKNTAYTRRFVMLLCYAEDTHLEASIKWTSVIYSSL